MGDSGMIKHTKEYEDSLYIRIHNMTREEREALDPVSKAIRDYVTKSTFGVTIVPNRISALMAIDAHTARNTALWEESYEV